MLRGVRDIIEELWRALAGTGINAGIADGVPDALVGLGVE